MKSNARKSLFSLLVKNYLAFTLALLFIAGGVYLLWNGVYNHMFRPNNVDGLMRSAAFLTGRYQDISPAQYLGNDGLLPCSGPTAPWSMSLTRFWRGPERPGS